MKYFHINDTKFNYDIEFKNNSDTSYWKQNTPLLEYCETLGINIPHYCYHKGLSISGNCRMCLIELKKSPKPIVSCAMNAKSCLANGDIFTNSSLVKKARENILEFLLLNHPLDCPICDQGGECDLQDQSLFFGLTKKRFYNFKRIVINKNIGPIVKTVMTRCIHCTRCVRFAAEIAGVESIGMFGRGLHSEIGTYVEKIFQSELSGNVIDLCPVGALTSKPYPFVSRNWELKNLTFIDFSDGLGTPTQLFIKNNQIIKILPGYDKTTYKTNWISDKTRFSFDGMFSPERVMYSFIKTDNKLIMGLSWKKLFQEIFYMLYFKNHLTKHLYQPYQIMICLTENISLEVLSLLYLLSRKYSFFKLRQSEPRNVNIDIDQNYLLNFDLNSSKILSSDTCFLIGINPRYEGSPLNLALRTRYLKGNFKVIQIGSLSNNTFSTHNISNNVKSLKSLIEGNSLFCQELVTALNPILISNSEIFKRKDSFGLTNSLKLLVKYIDTYSYSKTVKQLNILNAGLNESGVNTFNVLKAIRNLDFKNSQGIYFLNNSFNTYNVKKLLNLKLLNFFQHNESTNKFLITQNHTLETKRIALLKKNFHLENQIHLPNNVFFETSGTYIDTNGKVNNMTKVVTSLNQTKSDWQITRKIFSYCKKIFYTSNIFQSGKLVFNANTPHSFRNYIGFQHYATSNLNDLAFQLFKKIKKPTVKCLGFKPKRNKLFSSQLKFWLNDFYLDSKDCSTRYSSTMIQCSKFFRLENTNFKY